MQPATLYYEQNDGENDITASARNKFLMCRTVALVATFSVDVTRCERNWPRFLAEVDDPVETRIRLVFRRHWIVPKNQRVLLTALLTAKVGR